MIKNGRYEDDEGIQWYLNDELHRDGDLPAVERKDGTKEWLQHGEHHRDGDLPAFTQSNGTKEWLVRGKTHRTTGPAVIWSNGQKYWYLNNELVFCETQEEFEKLMRLKAFW